MAYRALTQVLRGNAPPVAVGEIVPDTYLDVHGEPQPLDFDRLLELGSVELVEDAPAAKRKAPAKADDAESAPRSKRASSRSKE